MLPAHPTVAEFDALQQQPAHWHAAIAALAAHLGSHRGADQSADAATVQPTTAGTVLVAFVGATQVLKLYPPFLQDHWAVEDAVLPLLHGRLAVPTPAPLARGHWQGWPYTLMSRLPGTPLDAAWPGLDEPTRCALLRQIGTLARQVHALPVQPLQHTALAWSDLLPGLRERCHARQQRTGLPAHLLAQLAGFLAGPLPEGPPVLLTGEYTPMNLLVQGGTLSGMFDFGDSYTGPAMMDWLGPLCFLAAGHPARCAAFLQGYGFSGRWDAPLRQCLLRGLLLHRYSHLKAQIAQPGWQQAGSFEDLAELIWGG